MTETSTARCAGSNDPDKWFRQDSWRDAIAECMACPIRTQCLADALKFETESYQRRMLEDDGRGCSPHCDGVWGGVTGPKRRRLIEVKVHGRAAA